MSKKEKIKELESVIYNLELDLQRSKTILNEISGKKQNNADHLKTAGRVGSEENIGNSVIVEGVFNGQIMIGPDGKEYSVPANYASKSKLVEGDILKLTIEPDGSFIFKQISPVDRQRLVGHIVKDHESGEFIVLAGDKVYKVLLASVTYFKGEVADEAVILVAKEASCEWAAIENIIKNKNGSSQSSADDFEITL
ncbi:hypothetical protein HON36_03100 [Candidatus Parcubacteria bacterium]|jgi:hypothetical protein|nr:hypothetical protein [Candidatus Parcubacteria bacterium]MBT7228145.1 hypothetical protein [Candidatus Parcubacteria bacterium]